MVDLKMEGLWSPFLFKHCRSYKPWVFTQWILTETDQIKKPIENQ